MNTRFALYSKIRSCIASLKGISLKFIVKQSCQNLIKKILKAKHFFFIFKLHSYVLVCPFAIVARFKKANGQTTTQSRHFNIKHTYLY